MNSFFTPTASSLSNKSVDTVVPIASDLNNVVEDEIQHEDFLAFAEGEN